MSHRQAGEQHDRSSYGSCRRGPEYQGDNLAGEKSVSAWFRLDKKADEASREVGGRCDRLEGEGHDAENGCGPAHSGDETIRLSQPHE